MKLFVSLFLLTAISNQIESKFPVNKQYARKLAEPCVKKEHASLMDVDELMVDSEMETKEKKCLASCVAGQFGIVDLLRVVRVLITQKVISAET